MMAFEVGPLADFFDTMPETLRFAASSHKRTGVVLGIRPSTCLLAQAPNGGCGQGSPSLRITVAATHSKDVHLVLHREAREAWEAFWMLVAAKRFGHRLAITQIFGYLPGSGLRAAIQRCCYRPAHEVCHRSDESASPGAATWLPPLLHRGPIKPSSREGAP